MPNNQQEVILGQLLTEKVQHLKSKVQTLFPNKKYHIGDLGDLMKAGMTDCIAVAIPEISRYIFIGINPDLHNSEFNTVLAEELFHHIQASEQYPTIVGLNLTKMSDKFVVSESLFEELCKKLCSKIYDLDAHPRMLDYGINLETIIAKDLMLVRNEIAESNSSEAKLAKLQEYKTTVFYFSTYLLWWFDLCELGFSKYVKIWNNEIRPWFVQKLSKDTLDCWDELTEFVHNNPVTNSQSAERVLRAICERLVCRTPIFAPIPISGMSIKSVLNPKKAQG